MKGLVIKDVLNLAKYLKTVFAVRRHIHTEQHGICGLWNGDIDDEHVCDNLPKLR